jgi:UDP-N-acetylmuramate: L-alanyl-gamma-D-glutamyl-meso-diaminopimelate ligase
MGCWTPVEKFSVAGEEWSIVNCSKDGKQFSVQINNKEVGTVDWSMHGAHNRLNALAAIAAARHAGVIAEDACRALTEFKGIKRRMEVIGEIGGVTVYDDFAHHPTAIIETLSAMKELSGNGRILAVLEPRSNTMRMGVHKKELLDSLQQADEIYLYQPKNIEWKLGDLAKHSSVVAKVYSDVAAIISDISERVRSGDHVIIMSNGGFDSIHTKLLQALEKKAA